MQARQPADVPAAAFGLTLHIRHPTLGPADISRELGWEPEEAFGAGEPRRSAGVYSETYWAARIEAPFWRATGYQRTFDPRPPVEAAGPPGSLPEDRPSRLKLLIARGREQGYLSYAELREYLPDDIREGEPLQDVARNLGELGIPVHEQASPHLAALQRVGAVQVAALQQYAARHAALQLNDVLALVCLRLASRHAGFLESIRTQGGSVRLLVTLAPRAVHGLTISPELGARLAQLGVTLELALAAGLNRPKSRSA
jgi:hypothetical protein